MNRVVSSAVALYLFSSAALARAVYVGAVPAASGALPAMTGKQRVHAADTAERRAARAARRAEEEQQERNRAAELQRLHSALRDGTLSPDGPLPQPWRLMCAGVVGDWWVGTPANWPDADGFVDDTPEELVDGPCPRQLVAPIGMFFRRDTLRWEPCVGQDLASCLLCRGNAAGRLAISPNLAGMHISSWGFGHWKSLMVPGLDGDSRHSGVRSLSSLLHLARGSPATSHRPQKSHRATRLSVRLEREYSSCCQ